MKITRHGSKGAHFQYYDPISNSLERSRHVGCIRHIHEEYQADPSLSSYTHMDAMILNVERACQAAIDSAMHVIASQKLGIPKNSGDAFNLLHLAGILSKELTERLKAMTGFLNIAVHQYQEIEIEVLDRIAKAGWMDFVEFCAQLGLSVDPEKRK